MRWMKSLSGVSHAFDVPLTGGMVNSICGLKRRLAIFYNEGDLKPPPRKACKYCKKMLALKARVSGDLDL